MTEKLKPGDRVKIRNHMLPEQLQRVWEITEIDIRDSGYPAAPSTYLVRMKPTGGGGPVVYGNAALERAD